MSGIKAWPVLGMMFICTGCYVQPIEDQRNENDKKNSDKFDLNGRRGECLLDKYSGCFSGEVPPAPHIVVDGIEFDDADTLRNRFFKDLILPKLKTAEGAETRTDVTFEWVTSLRNDNFGHDVQVFIKGGAARYQNVLVDYQFHLNNLPEERYEIRVQKPLKFILRRPVAAAATPTPVPTATPAVPEASRAPQPAVVKATPKPEFKVQTVCARLVADASFDIQKEQRTRKTFNEYHLLVSEDDCGRSSNGSDQQIVF